MSVLRRGAECVLLGLRGEEGRDQGLEDVDREATAGKVEEERKSGAFFESTIKVEKEILVKTRREHREEDRMFQ